MDFDFFNEKSSIKLIIADGFGNEVDQKLYRGSLSKGLNRF